jgi:creatinine amidohydrolase
MREWMLAEQNHGSIRQFHWEVAVLPFGATEPHNLHMPYGTDNFQVEKLADVAGERAFRAGAKVIVLPTVPFGVNTNHLRIPGGLACSVTPSTLLHVVTDLVDSLERQGVKKILLLNGHGGNELKPIVRELHHRTTTFLCVCDWFRMAADTYADIFEAPGEHADEVETSLGLAYFPNLVQGDKADEGKERSTGFEAIDRGWVNITRPWHLATTNTGLGNPFAATKEKGARLMDVLVERLSRFLIDLSARPFGANFPYDLS